MPHGPSHATRAGQPRYGFFLGIDVTARQLERERFERGPILAMNTTMPSGVKGKTVTQSAAANTKYG